MSHTASPRLHPQLKQGLVHHTRGEIRRAARCYLRAHRANRRDPEALLLLGSLARRSQRPGAAVRLLQRAVSLRPHAPHLRTNLGAALLALGDLDAAEYQLRFAMALDSQGTAPCLQLAELYRIRQQPEAMGHWFFRAHTLAPGVAEIYLHTGRQFALEKRLEAALAVLEAGCGFFPGHFAMALAAASAALGVRKATVAICHARRAVALQPGAGQAHLLLGNAYAVQGSLLDAVLSYQQAIQAAPDDAEPLCNLGNALLKLGDAAEATRCFHRALALRPDCAASLHSLGAALARQDDHGGAEAAFRATLALSSGNAEIYNSLGATLLHLRSGPEAESCFRRALGLDPLSAIAWCNLGNALRLRGAETEMRVCYERAVALEPECAGARYNLGLADLRAGRLQAGWEGYRHRFSFRELRTPARHSQLPAWQGEPLRGRTLLIHAEQGLGDSLQFVRYVSLLAAQGGQVLLEVQPPLLRLLADLPGVTHTFAAGGAVPARAELQCPLMELPRILGTTLDSIPGRTPYLSVRLAAVDAAWAAFPGKGLRVGVVWAGNPRFRGDAERSIPFSLVEPLLDVPGVHFFSLQKGAAAEHTGEVAPSVLRNAGPEMGDFLDTAALVSTLDLVVSVDTAVAHLAGALGRPAWILLPHLADWRWLKDREDSPWYPQARLFRQRTPGDLEGVLFRVRQELAALVQGREDDAQAAAHPVG